MFVFVVIVVPLGSDLLITSLAVAQRVHFGLVEESSGQCLAAVRTEETVRMIDFLFVCCHDIDDLLFASGADRRITRRAAAGLSIGIH